MGKHKPKRQRPNGLHSYTSKSRTHNLNAESQSAKPKPNLSTEKAHTQSQHTAPTIPFSVDDRILLIGEADLTFARSLIEHHSCTHVIATVLEKDVEELAGKYPHVSENIAVVEKGGGKVVYGIDAMKMGAWTEGKGAGSQRVGGMDKVVFNFPHVGGKSTDVNRQVRYNQGMDEAESFTQILADNEWHRASGFVLQEGYAVRCTWWLNHRHAI
jgi:25S rRNA (uracil2634-N3)-methyltransferase